MKLTEKTIWITGASAGIGKAMALNLSKNNNHLILSGRNVATLEETARQCIMHGSKVQMAVFDLGEPAAIQGAVEKILKETSGIDCLFQVGGISQRSLVKDTPLAIDRKIMEVNFFGTVALTKAILPGMIARGGGHIAVTSSIVGKFGFPYRSAYSASKHALHGYYESLRAELKKENIRVSIIIPGRIQTDISLNAMNETGGAHGKMDDGQANGMAVDIAASRIIKELAAEKKEILVGGKELLMITIRRFLPALYYRISSKINPL